MVRGLGIRLCAVMCGGERLAIGRGLRVYRDVRICTRKTSSIAIGRNVRIEQGSVVSAVGSGHIKLGDGVSLGALNRIVCHEQIEIGSNTMFAPNVMLYDHDHVIEKGKGAKRREYKTAPILIGENCWIGAGVIILKGTQIGDNCVIGAGCVLKGTFESGSVVTQKRETVVR